MTYNREYLLSRYNRRIQICKDELGNKCIDCGTQNSLEFDHIDKANKTGNITSLAFRPWGVLLEEVHKCVLRCTSCHKKRHNQERPKAKIIERKGYVSKLSVEQIEQLLEDKRQGMTYPQLMKKYNVSRGSIGYYNRGYRTSKTRKQIPVI